MNSDFTFGCLRVALMPSRDLLVHQGGFIHPWCLPGSFQDGKAIALNDAKGTLESTDEARTGEAVTMRLRPALPSAWKDLRPKDELIVHAGLTPAGTAVVLERVPEAAMSGYFSDRHITVSPLEFDAVNAGLVHGILLDQRTHTRLVNSWPTPWANSASL